MEGCHFPQLDNKRGGVGSPLHFCTRQILQIQKNWKGKLNNLPPLPFPLLPSSLLTLPIISNRLFNKPLQSVFVKEYLM